jgi:hypothetical protein
VEIADIALETMTIWWSNYLDGKRDTGDFHAFERDT